MKFDQIYHEHVSYFTVKYLKSFLQKINLSITHIQETEYHGGSLRVFVENKSLLGDRIVKNYIKKEEVQGLFKKKHMIILCKS